MTRLFLVRHGATGLNGDAVYRGRAKVPLSARGLAQARALGARFASEAATKVLSSPLDRALETARAIGDGCRLPVDVCDDLTDIDCGEWEGLSDARVKELYPDLRRMWLRTPHLVSLPGGESLEDVRRRAARVRGAVENAGGSIVLVSHRVVHKVLICLLLGLDLSRFWDIRLDLAGITVFDCGEARRVLVAHNDTCHLAREQHPGRGDL